MDQKKMKQWRFTYMLMYSRGFKPFNKLQKTRDIPNNWRAHLGNHKLLNKNLKMVKRLMEKRIGYLLMIVDIRVILQQPWHKVDDPQQL